MSADLFSWITGRAIWQQELMFRICESGRLSEKDFDELRLMVERAQGATVEVQPARTLDRGHLGNRSEEEPATILVELGPVSHVDRLAPGQRPIRFATVGVTLVYGNNGSGKSGFCRIAKALCRCVHKQAVRGNAYAAGEPAPEVVLAFQAGNRSPERRTWRAGEAPPSELARLSVFDGDAARVYVDGERKVEFLPHDLDLLTRFTRGLAELAERFRLEESALRAAVKTPTSTGYTKGTPVHALTERLRVGGSLPTEEDFRALGAWDDANERSLSDAYDAVRRGAAVVSKERRDLARRISTVVKAMGEVAALLDEGGIRALMQSRDDAERARSVATMRAGEMFGL